jgi:uncharacterized protein (TIGR02118 family)
MIKRIGCAIRHPTNRSLADFQAYWAEKHGPLFAHTPNVLRYVQHITLPEAYGGTPAPTHDGVSMFWYDGVAAMVDPPPSPTLAEIVPATHTGTYEWYVQSSRYGSPATMTLAETVTADDRQLFDRATDWPTAHRRSNVTASERVVLEGETSPSMVKALFMVARRPGLTIAEFQQHWLEGHGPLVTRVPGLRRYVQNHAVLELYGTPNRPMTHDGFAELWFDDLGAFQRAYTSPEWAAVRADGQRLFAQPVGLVIARERIQKDFPPT